MKTMDFSWELGANIFVACTTCALTVMWTTLRAQSKTIDKLTNTTKYLATQSACLTLLLWKNMKEKTTGKIEEEHPVHEIEIEEEQEPVQAEWTYSDPFSEPFDPFGDPFDTFESAVEPVIPSIPSSGSPTSNSNSNDLDGEW